MSGGAVTIDREAVALDGSSDEQGDVNRSDEAEGRDDLPYPDRHFCEAAEGWLMIGDARSALHELGKLSLPNQFQLWPLHQKCRAHEVLEEWDHALKASREFVDRFPLHPFGWVYHASILCFTGRKREAYEMAKDALRLFPDHTGLLVDIAGYACDLGMVEEGAKWMDKALDVDPWLFKLVFDNPRWAALEWYLRKR